MIITNIKVPSDFGVNFNCKIYTEYTVDSKTKFLEFIIDDKLSFSFQVDHLSNELARVVGVLRRLSVILPPSALRSLHDLHLAE